MTQATVTKGGPRDRKDLARVDEEVEFVTIMRFDSWDAVRRFSGENYERSYVPPKAPEVLARFDEHSRHYEVRESLEYRP